LASDPLIFPPTQIPEAPDYTAPTSWLVLPDMPGAQRVDIFWVYPTVLNDDEHWLMPPDNRGLRSAAMHSIVTQASVFSGQANIYAPIYRQMNMAALGLTESQRQSLFSYGVKDVERALTYYLEHYNHGRPFILAGHSQGSNILADIIRRRWSHLGVENRMVAGYLIGWSITRDDLKANPALTMCADADQINCFVSYNTVAEGRQQQAPTILPGAIVTNPLNWKLNNDFAPPALNLGTTFFDLDGSSRTYPHFTSAQVKDGGLVVQPADPTLLTTKDTTFPRGVYHVYDYSLFYENLRQNIKQRINAFFNQTK